MGGGTCTTRTPAPSSKGTRDHVGQGLCKLPQQQHPRNVVRMVLRDSHGEVMGQPWGLQEGVRP